MKSLKILAMLVLGLVFIKHDTSACTDKDSKDGEQKKRTEIVARSAYRALKAVTPAKADLHPDFMIGNSQLRF
ncbi:MAG TPA: hypothetical protein VGE66_00365 [Chitinophagaceae bacterium]